MQQHDEAGEQSGLPARFWTSGRIAETSGYPHRAVLYVIETRDVQPIGLAAHLKIYDQAAVDFIVSELRAIRGEPRGAAQ